MSVILNYFAAMSGYMLVAILIYAVARKVQLKKHKEKPDLLREICTAVLIALAVGILSQTVFPQIDCGITDKGFYMDFKFLPGVIFGYDCGDFFFDVMPNAERSINLVPFKTISGFFGANEGPFSDRDWNISRAVNLLGNIILFVPLGFLLPISFKKTERFVNMFLVGSGYVLFIEITQYFIFRVSDIDDYILNMLGIILGFYAYKILKKMISVSKSKKLSAG